MAQEAALKEFAAGRLRRLLAFNKSLTCADKDIGDAALFYKAQSEGGAPRRRVPALILDIDETGAIVKFQSQMRKAARFCVRKKGEEKDVEDAELDPVRTRFRQSGADLGSQLRHVDVEKDMEVEREDGNSTLNTGPPKSGSGPWPEVIPVPDPPSLSAQLPSPHVTMDKQRHVGSTFGMKCAPSQAPRAAGPSMMN